MLFADPSELFCFAIIEFVPLSIIGYIAYVGWSRRRERELRGEVPPAYDWHDEEATSPYGDWAQEMIKNEKAKKS